MPKPTCPPHLAKCEAAAAAVLAKKKDVTHGDVLKAFRQIDAADWPTQTRPNVAPNASCPEVTGMVLGLSPNRQGGCSLAQGSKQCPALTKLVTAWIRSTLGDADFRYGSIQVNYNYRARKHIDSNNLGPSYIISLGTHEGGKLWTGDRGVLDCKEKWCLFDGNTEHATEPYTGRDRFSFILFTPDRYNRLDRDVCKQARALGLTACSTAGVDDAYFSNYRDLAPVDEDDHVAFTEKHHEQNPPSHGAGALSVETNGYAAGRGWGWIAWQTGAKGDDEVHVEHFKKNATGIHVVELDVVAPKKPGQVLTFKLREVHRFNLYQDTAAESARFQKWVEQLPTNTVVGCCITDTAMAKTRPLGAPVYEAFRALGAASTLTLIGYREPFCFLGWKGAKPGEGCYALDAKKQSKQLLRLDATVTRGASGDLAMTWKTKQVKLLDELSRPAKKAKKDA